MEREGKKFERQNSWQHIPSYSKLRKRKLLTKEITPKFCRYSVCVLINKRSFDRLCVCVLINKRSFDRLCLYPNK